MGLDPGAPARRGVPAPGLQKLRLHEVQRRPHRLVMRADHAAVADHQRLQRHRLGRREGDVPARTVLVPALAHPPEIDVGPRNPAGQHLLEERRPHMRAQALRLRRRAVPEARLAMLRVVPGVIPVALEIPHRDGGGPELEDRGYHAVRPSERKFALIRLRLVRIRLVRLRRIGALRLTGVLRCARGLWLASRLFIPRRSGPWLDGLLFVPRRSGLWLEGLLFVLRGAACGSTAFSSSCAGVACGSTAFSSSRAGAAASSFSSARNSRTPSRSSRCSSGVSAVNVFSSPETSRSINILT